MTAQTISVASTNARVQADELTGRDIELHTTNAVISGRVNLVAVPSLREASKAQGKLVMQTQNGYAPHLRFPFLLTHSLKIGRAHV